MADLVKIRINGRDTQVATGTSVAAAIMSTGISTFRVSVGGSPRGPLCGMGICFECRVTIDGIRHETSCNVVCRDGMEVETDRA